MNDRELLELAAKAAGYAFKWGADWHDIGGSYIGDTPWNPLEDDGDAFRIAVKLNIHILRFESMTNAKPMLSDWGCDERDDGNPCAATRRAIVRAAAEIGKQMTKPIPPVYP